MNLKNLTNQDLHKNLCTLAATERRITLEILHHLMEIEARRFHAQLGYSSLFKYCTQELKYSASRAQRRISAQRLLREIPQIGPQVGDGTVNVSQLAQLATYFKAIKSTNKSAGKSNDRSDAQTPAQKLHLAQSIAGLSTRETERALLSQSLTYTYHVQTRPQTRAISADLTELKLVVDQKFMQLLEHTRTACAHNRDMNPQLQDLLKRGLELLLTHQQKKRGLDCTKTSVKMNRQEVSIERNKPVVPQICNEQKNDVIIAQHKNKTPKGELLLQPLPGAALSRSMNANPTISTGITPTSTVDAAPFLPAPKVLSEVKDEEKSYQKVEIETEVKSGLKSRSRYLLIHTKREVATRAKGQCEFTTQDGIQCSSTHALEFHHVIAYAKNGANSAQNLRLFCRMHNQLEAEREFGARPQ